MQNPQFQRQNSAPQPISKDRSPRTSTEMRRTRFTDSSTTASSPMGRSNEKHGCPPASSAGRGSLSETAMQKTFHEAMRHRRTSLPASSISFTKTTPIGGSNITEARGLVADMLASKELPCHVASCLKAVASLLTPITIQNLTNHSDFGLPCVVENPYSGEKLIVSSASKPRVSNITFSTVTSATGLPTIAAEPNRPRSSRSESYWKPDHATSNGPSSLVETPVSNHLDGVSPCSSFVISEEIKVKETSDEDTTTQGSSSTDTCTPSSSVVYTVDGVTYDTQEMDVDPYLGRVSDWSLPIFDMADKYKTSVLSRLTYTVFKQADLFRIFKVNTTKFFNYFHQLEMGYWDIPYHNRVHAADVLHGVYYLTCHPVHPLFGRPPTPDSPTVPSVAPAAVPVIESMTTLELMALYTAAAMHDFDHPGRTNAFLVAVEDPKAIMYNDRSVLENHHAAESWRLLQKKENCFIEGLDAAETKRFRYLVLEYILATDLKQHFEIIMTFNEKSTEMELTNESDRVLVAKMLIKLADINSPSKPYQLHRQWTDRICEEFYEQGDEEKKRGMAVTPYMDRNDPAVAKLQDSFIAHVVSPLAVALNEIGLLPTLPGLEEPEIMINLKHNHQKWLLELDNGSSSSGVGTGNETIEEESSTSESPDNRMKRSPSVDSVGEVEFEMCTIHENEEEYL